MTINVYLLLFAASYLAAKILLPSIFAVLKDAGAVKQNWEEKTITGMAGLVFPLLTGLIGLLLLAFQKSDQTMVVSLFAVYGIAFLGLIDDTLGNDGPRGLQGHFSQLWHKKKVSTGVIKAVGSAAIALWVVFSLEGGFIDWLLLVLTVNFVNLLDLRPGRAVKGVGFFLLLALIFPLADYRLLSITAGLLLAYARYDLQGLVMLGDTGSNTLGVICGLILLPAPLWLKIILAAALTIFHVLAEKYSFSVIIEKNALLRAIDRWGRS